MAPLRHLSTPVPSGPLLDPLLTGERGEYELATGADAAASAQERLDTMARSADDASFFLAEQVWDDRPPSAEGTEFVPGEPTFSATPLAWTHAGFIRLARAVDAGRPVDTPDVVACRCQTPLCQG